jgi:membrane protease YdiL (CAAX protease family)
MTSVPPPPYQHPGSPPWRPELPEGVTASAAPPPALPPEAPPRTGLAAVPGWAPLAAMIAVFVVAALAFVVIGVGIEAGGGTVTEDGPPGLVISATLVQDLGFIAVVLVFTSFWSRGVTPAAFGLRLTRFWPAVGWMALTFATFWILTLIYLLIVGEPQEQELTRDLKEEESLITLIAYGALLAVVAPLAEEFFFRGFMFGVFRERIGPLWGAVATATIFGLVHVAGSPLKTVVVLFILGLGLCFLYWRTGSLLPCIALHAINNSISFGATKSLPPLAFLAVVVGCTALCVGFASTFVRRPQPAT